MKMEWDYLYGWIRKQSSMQKSPKMVDPKDIAGNTEEEEEWPWRSLKFTGLQGS